jgi:SPP1 gp7 family putative phage head morphogenesis protein
MNIHPKPKVARAVWPNAAIRNRYRHNLVMMIREMAVAVERLLTEQRKAEPPATANDESPVEAMRGKLKGLSQEWQSRFEAMAPKVAETFLKNQFKGTDSAFRQALREAGWSIEFTLTPAMREAFEASLAQNVGLINSIPVQYLQEVEGIVMRNYAAGRNLKSMVEELRGRYAVASDRAWLIARDQSNKANAVVQKARQTELGITQAIWLHSHAGRHPRPTHVAMNRKRYDVAKGMWDSAVKKWILPGEEINCRCSSRSVLPWTPSENASTNPTHSHPTGLRAQIGIQSRKP